MRARSDRDARVGSLHRCETSGRNGDGLLAGFLLLLGGTGLASELDVPVANVALKADSSLVAAAAESGLGLAGVLALVRARLSLAAVVVEGVRLLEIGGEHTCLSGGYHACAERGRRSAHRRWS